MIVTMTARYDALHYDEAVAKGTAIWRDFISDPGADLPWDASIRVELGSATAENAAGEKTVIRPVGEAVLNVKISRSQE